MRMARLMLCLVTLTSCATIQEVREVQLETKPQVEVSVRQEKVNLPVEADSISVLRYHDLLDSIRRFYFRQQASFAKRNSGLRLAFDFVPITLFPFFCSQHVEPVGQVQYFDRSEHSVKLISQNQVIVAGVSFIRKDMPETKFYRLFRYSWTNSWRLEEIEVITFTKQNDTDYGCEGSKNESITKTR